MSKELGKEMREYAEKYFSKKKAVVTKLKVDSIAPHYDNPVTGFYADSEQTRRFI